MVICLERGADLHMDRLMPLPLTVCCLSKIPIGFTILVPAHPGSPGQRAVKRVCVCVYFLSLTMCFSVLVYTFMSRVPCASCHSSTSSNKESSFPPDHPKTRAWAISDLSMFRPPASLAPPVGYGYF